MKDRMEMSRTLPDTGDLVSFGPGTGGPFYVKGVWQRDEGDCPLVVFIGDDARPLRLDEFVDCTVSSEAVSFSLPGACKWTLDLSKLPVPAELVDAARVALDALHSYAEIAPYASDQGAISGLVMAIRQLDERRNHLSVRGQLCKAVEDAFTERNSQLRNIQWAAPLFRGAGVKGTFDMDVSLACEGRDWSGEEFGDDCEAFGDYSLTDHEQDELTGSIPAQLVEGLEHDDGVAYAMMTGEYMVVSPERAGDMLHLTLRCDITVETPEVD